MAIQTLLIVMGIPISSVLVKSIDILQSKTENKMTEQGDNSTKEVKPLELLNFEESLELTTSTDDI